MFYIFFCSFTLLVCEEKNILPNLINSQEPESFFLAPWEPEPLEKKQELEPLGKKIMSRSPLKNSWGAGAAKKFPANIIDHQNSKIISKHPLENKLQSLYERFMRDSLVFTEISLNEC